MKKLLLIILAVTFLCSCNANTSEISTSKTIFTDQHSTKGTITETSTIPPEMLSENGIFDTEYYDLNEFKKVKISPQITPCFRA